MKRYLLAILCVIFVGSSAFTSAASFTPDIALLSTASENIEAKVYPPETETPFAPDSTEENKKYEPTTEDLERIIKLIKPKFDVPEEYENFSWNYSAGNYSTPSIWRLSWSHPEGKGSININSDNKGHITSFRESVWRENYKVSLPFYLKSELIDTANEFLNKITPETADSFVMKRSTSSGIYSGNYTYYYVREENGIPMPSNTASVSVDNKTGKVIFFQLNYAYDLKIEKPSVLISPERAIEILGTEQEMELSYRNKYIEIDGDYKTAAYLVYTPKLSYIAVDAVTGEIYKEQSEWTTLEERIGIDDMMDMSNMKQAMPESAVGGGDYEYELNEKELEQLGVLEQLISREDAIKIITENDMLYINPDLTTIDATLNKGGGYYYPIYRSYNNDENYYWSINFNDPTPSKAYSYAYASARIDAKDGSLVYFQSSLNSESYYSGNKIEFPKVKYNNQQAQEIMEKFFEKEASEKFANTKLSQSYPFNVVEYKTTGDIRTPIYGAYQYTYNRINEDIEYPYNSLYGAVDGVTGKVVSFGYNWEENVEFESPDDAISSDEAYQIFMNLDGFGLNYEINNKYTYHKYMIDEKNQDSFIDYNDLYEYEKEIRLVYSAYETYPAIISALTGKQINYSGEEYIPSEDSSAGYIYNDITGHWAERTIQLFADIGVGFSKGSFSPDKAVTDEEFKTFLSGAGLYYNYNEKQESVEIDRVMAVRNIIEALGYKEIADIQNIFRTDFEDSENIKPEDMGYIAIARGLNIIQGSDGSFRPYDILTRAEALTLINNVLER